VVRLRFASDHDGILCAATFIGEIIASEFDLFVESLLEKEGMLNSHENLQFWQIAQPLPTPNIVNFGSFVSGVRDAPAHTPCNVELARISD